MSQIPRITTPTIIIPISPTTGQPMSQDRQQELRQQRTASRLSSGGSQITPSVDVQKPLDIAQKIPAPSQQDLNVRDAQSVESYNLQLKSYQDQFVRSEGFRPGEPLYLELGKEGLKDDILVKDEDDSLFKRSGFVVDGKSLQKDWVDRSKELEQKRRDDLSFSRSVVSAEPDPDKLFFGSRPPGKETISLTPSYDVGVAERGLATAQKVDYFLLTTFVPQYWGVSKETYLSDIYSDRGNVANILLRTGERVKEDFRGLEWEDRLTSDRGVSFVEGFFGRFGSVETQEFYAEREERWGLLADRVGESSLGVVKGVGEVFGEVVEDPYTNIGLFFLGGVAGKSVAVLKPVAVKYSAWVGSKSLPVRSALKGVGIGLKTSAVGVIGGGVALDIAQAENKILRTAQITKDFALLGAGFRAGQKLNINFPSFKRSTDLTFKPTGGEWKLKTNIQGRDVQTTLSGGTITPKEIYTVRTQAGAPSLKKSPLGLDEWYKSTEGLKESVKLRLTPRGVDSKTGNIVFDAKQLRSGSNIRLDESFPVFKTSLTESGQPIITGTQTFGVKTKPLTEPLMRLVDVKTGKEYNVPSSFVQRRLAENPNLQFISKTQKDKFLFASDPLTAIATTIKPLEYSITPQIKTAQLTSPAQTPSSVLKSRFSSPALSPLLITPSFLKKENEGVISIIEEKQEDRDQNQIISSPLFLSSSQKELLNVEILSVEKQEQNVLISPRTFTASRIKSAEKNLVQTSTQTQTIQVTQQTPLIQNIQTPTQTNILKELISPQRRLITSPFSNFKMSTPSQRVGAGFVVSVRREGVFNPVGFFSTPEQAFREGQRIVGETAGASFKVKDDKGSIVDPWWGVISKKFRPAKTEPGVVVERRRYRISSPGELQEITYKGLMAQRIKRERGRSGFNLF